MLNFKRFAALVLCLLCLIFSSFANASEYIEHFNSDITVNPDGSLTITETLTVHHEGRQIRRGLARGLSTAKGEHYDIIDVTRNGNPEPWFTKKGNGQLTLNTGDDTYLPAPGVSTFVITYNMYDSLRKIKGEDLNELYLNITGKWDFPIKKLDVTVGFPEGTELIRQYQYQTNKQALKLPANGTFSFPYINTNTEATIAIAFSQNTVDIPVPQTFKYLLYAFFLTLAYYLIAWVLFGIDPASRPIVPTWEPPADLTPLECAFIDNNGNEPKNAFFTQILYLAHKKLITITENKAGKSYTLKRNIFPLDTPKQHRLTLIQLDNLTLDGTPNGTAERCSNHIIENAEKNVKSRCYFTNRLALNLGAFIIPLASLFIDTGLFYLIWLFWPLMLFASKKNKLFVFLIQLQIALPEFINHAEAISSISIFSFALYVALYYLFKYLLFQPTLSGQRIKEQIEGLKMFLKTITKNGTSPRITTLKDGLSQEKRLTPEDMEELFPYAVAFGLEKQWQQKFISVFGAARYAQAVSDIDYYHPRYRNSFCKTCNKSAVSPSTHSNGSGSYGHGFAGGGFGGGRSGGR